MIIIPERHARQTFSRGLGLVGHAVGASKGSQSARLAILIEACRSTNEHGWSSRKHASAQRAQLAIFDAVGPAVVGPAVVVQPLLVQQLLVLALLVQRCWSSSGWSSSCWSCRCWSSPACQLVRAWWHSAAHTVLVPKPKRESSGPSPNNN